MQGHHRLGVNLKKAREAKGLTQEALAREVGVAWITISRYERGVSNPSLGMLDRLAHALEIQPSVLLQEVAAA